MSTKVLIVEDNSDSCAFLARLLELKGYQVSTARDGMEALYQIASFEPDVIVSDIMMPRVDGIQMVRMLRSMPKHRDTPVVMVSAFGSGNLNEAVKAGADKAMRKPLDCDQFLKTIERLVKRETLPG